MKQRIGFVSNSSSSSFVIVGWRLKEKQAVTVLSKLLTLPQKEGEDDSEFIWRASQAFGKKYKNLTVQMDEMEKKYFFGVSVAHWNYEGEYGSMPLAQATKEATDIAKRTGLTDEIQIIGGEIGC